PQGQRRPQASAWPAQQEAAGGTAPTRADRQAEGGVRVQAPLPGRQAAGELPGQGRGQLPRDVRIPAGTAGAAAVLPGGVSTVRRRAGGAAGAAAADAVAEEGGVPGDPGVGAGAGVAEPG